MIEKASCYPSYWLNTVQNNLFFDTTHHLLFRMSIFSTGEDIDKSLVHYLTRHIPYYECC